MEEGENIGGLRLMLWQGKGAQWVEDLGGWGLGLISRISGWQVCMRSLDHVWVKGTGWGWLGIPWVDAANMTTLCLRLSAFMERVDEIITWIYPTATRLSASLTYA